MSWFAGVSIGVVGKTNEKIGVIKMFEVKAYVTEIEPGHVYSVDVDGFEKIVNACKEIYNGVVTFKSALTRVLEYNYGDCDFDFVCCGVKNGVGCYVVSIDDYVW